MEIKPVRIQRSRQHKQVSPNGLPIVYVGRSRDGSLNIGEFGNPFKMGGWYKVGKGGDGTFGYIQAYEGYQDASFTKLETVEQCIEFYKLYMKNYPLSAKRKERLKGKNLSCWCALDKPCHADILLEIANS